MRDDLGIDVAFPHPAGDQLGVLSAEVDDQNDLLGMGDGVAHASTVSTAFWSSLIDS